MIIPDHTLKKYANKTLQAKLGGAYHLLPPEVVDAMYEASGSDADFVKNHERLLVLIETAHIGLSWMKEN